MINQRPQRQAVELKDDVMFKLCNKSEYHEIIVTR